MNQYYSPLKALYQWEADSPEKIYLHQPIDGKYYTWQKLFNENTYVETNI